MAFGAARAAGLSSRRWSDTIAIVFASVIVSLGAATWISSSGEMALASAPLPETTDQLTFEDRFLLSHGPSQAGLQPLDRRALSFIEMKLLTAKGLLARRLVSEDWRAVFEEPKSEEPNSEGPKSDEAKLDEPKPSRTALIPLPRSRPVAADLDARPASALAQVGNTTRQDDRTLMQKLSDLLPGRITLASLAPNGGLFRQGPDLAALGFDSQTAVYDITAHAVYLPSGLSLEAHSGMGNLRDDPEHVSVRMAGATPPAVYDLKPREQPFHGVDALRMTPVEGSDVSGRSGLLVHPFMLGPNGDSNGCVSIKNYDRFLKAFNDGEVNRLVVVPSLRSLSTTAMATQRS